MRLRAPEPLLITGGAVHAEIPGNILLLHQPRQQLLERRLNLAAILTQLGLDVRQPDEREHLSFGKSSPCSQVRLWVVDKLKGRVGWRLAPGSNDAVCLVKAGLRRGRLQRPQRGRGQASASGVTRP
jgi:hypothetical protein